MLVINAQNVNDALPLGIMHLKDKGVPVVSRGMRTIEYPTPVTTVYDRPDQCVLFDFERDANPYFHFFEAMWILAGSNDVKPMTHFLPKLAEYSDDGVVFHGAYGYRLRHQFGFDQLEALIKMLRKTPDTRRAVANIYQANLDLDVDSRDIPCNDMLMFSIRNGELNLTVSNRSNDLIWGLAGANAVQFSFILQYMAARIGVEVGTYYQVSNSMHAYEDNPYWMLRRDYTGLGLGNSNPYDFLRGASVLKMWDMPGHLDDDIQVFIQAIRIHDIYTILSYPFMNTIIKEVARPMYLSFHAHKNKRRQEAMAHALVIKALDWRMACVDWLERRYVK